jgi:hypothetical protein
MMGIVKHSAYDMLLLHFLYAQGEVSSALNGLETGETLRFVKYSGVLARSTRDS